MTVKRIVFVLGIIYSFNSLAQNKEPTLSETADWVVTKILQCGGGGFLSRNYPSQLNRPMEFTANGYQNVKFDESINQLILKWEQKNESYTTELIVYHNINESYTINYNLSQVNSQLIWTNSEYEGQRYLTVNFKSKVPNKMTSRYHKKEELFSLNGVFRANPVFEETEMFEHGNIVFKLDCINSIENFQIRFTKALINLIVGCGGHLVEEKY